MKTSVTYRLNQAIRWSKATSVERAYVRGRIAKRSPSRRIRLWLKRNNGKPTQRALNVLQCARFSTASEQLWLECIIRYELSGIVWTTPSRTHAASRTRKMFWRELRRLGGASSSEIARVFNVSKRIVNKALSQKKKLAKPLAPR